MNPNELADELDAALKAVGLNDNRVPMVLRQQHAIIEALDKKVTQLKEHIAHLESQVYGGTTK